MDARVPTAAEQREWDNREKDFFRGVGQRLRDVLPHDVWDGLGVDERRERFERARDQLHDWMSLKLPAPIIWTDDLDNAGAAYDQDSDDGDIHYPEHHLETAEPEELVRGLVEEMRHAWQDDVRRGLTEHPLGEVGRRAIEHGFATYKENDARNDSTNRLELDAKERAEWAVDGYLAKSAG